MSANDEQIAIGSIFHSDFRVVRRLSSGGMGAVYVVEQLSTGAQRALKVMKPELMHSADLRRRFELEACVASRIPSEHVVQVITAGIDAATDMPFLVMELLSGADLADVALRDGPFSLSRVRTVFDQLCHALGRAHAAGIVHRDLKPENIFLATSLRADEGTTVKVLDFGIAKIVSEARTTETAAIGTPTWMAPEQTERGGAISPATDVWALGLIAFTLLTGKPYWLAAQAGGGSVATLFRELLFETLASASERARALDAPRLPAGFDAWFSQCVNRDPALRFPDASRAHAAFVRDVGADADRVTPALPASRPLPPPAREATVLGAPIHLRAAPASSAPPHKARAGSSTASLVVVTLAGMAALAGVIVVMRWAFGHNAHCTPGQGQECLDACDQGSRVACDTLAQMYESGSGVSKSPQEAVNAYSKACDAGLASSCGALADLLRTGRFGLAENAFSPAEKACKEKDARGCHALGMLTASVRSDIPKAEHLLKEACEVKYAASCSELGVLAERVGRTLEARAFYEKGCKLSDADGCNALGTLYLRGTDVGQDLPTAAQHFEDGCRAGSARACGLAGAAIFPAHEGDYRAKRASELLQKACNVDVYEPVACERLARALELGYGVSRDVKRAGELYRTVCRGSEQREREELLACARATTRFGASAVDEGYGFRSLQNGCDGGDPWGCVEAGLRLEAGRGVAKDVERAGKLFKKACGLSDPLDPTSKIACMRGVEREGAALLAAGDAEGAETKFVAACEAGAGHGCLQIANLRAKELDALNAKVPGIKPCDDACRRNKVSRASMSYFAACDAAVPAPEACRLGAEWSSLRGLIEPTFGYEKLRRGCRLGDDETCRYLDERKIAR